MIDPNSPFRRPLAGITRSGTLHIANGREVRLDGTIVLLTQCRSDLRMDPVSDVQFYPDRPRCKRCNWSGKPKLKLAPPSRAARLSDHEKWA
ncbi:hypothetical protein E3_0360 [Rhodococcus phage E3]|uniref:hypothetical protein n=1 Tax=Rhodococcus phage E3 TaxID=1007869 RepID=UPI0002C6B1E6|nr:hypothetical protein M176_gp037 [Rhodococcus phage E3]AEQ20947.1 hypothetical protein E3_0360 [Rhodococcus phage E3]